jgi:hypothetical protein
VALKRHRDLVVLLQSAVPERLVDPSDAPDAERLELDCPEGPQAGAAEHVNSLLHRPHDFLVADLGAPVRQPSTMAITRGRRCSSRQTSPSAAGGRQTASSSASTLVAVSAGPRKT